MKCSCYLRGEGTIARAPHAQDVNVGERVCEMFTIWLGKCVGSCGLVDGARVLCGR